MDNELEDASLATLRDYSAGRLGTRETIEQLNLHDFADLLIVLAQHDLHLPKPADTPQRRAHIARASAILQPLLRHAD